MPPTDSDLELYGHLSPGDEWAVPGGFAYGDLDAPRLSGTRLAAFERCFLGIGSFGHVPTVEVAEIDEAELETLKLQLAMSMVSKLGAPGLGAALSVAADEIAYTLSLATLPPGTRLVLEREWADDGIREDIKRVQPPRPQVDHGEVRLWAAAEKTDL